MADFVAVIRKAVDGLANNTPENRAKVYDKARSAVVRQLENMKPRPPEELLRRQIAKLDAAIAEVDSEYAEALPALEEDDAFSPVAEDAAAPYHQKSKKTTARRMRPSLLRTKSRSRFMRSPPPSRPTSASRSTKSRPPKKNPAVKRP